MPRSLLAATAFAIALTLSATAADEPKEKKGEVLKQVISVTAAFDKDKKKLTVTAVGQVPTGGWTGAKLTPRKAEAAPKDGVYEFDLTAVRPTGIVTQALSRVAAKYEWENPPADLKAVKVYGAGQGAVMAKVEK